VRNPAAHATVDPIDVTFGSAGTRPYFTSIDEIRQHVAARRVAASASNANWSEPEPDSGQ
jgi:hypothetical protein